ncbi:MAG: stage II sporulation protein M [Candidatus Pacebacteria bacterium]|nr:stage II sporulation protein M [Candidatus Paceibacterota bacterium]
MLKDKNFKKYFLYSFLVFLYSFLLGINFTLFFPEMAENALQQLIESFGGLGEMGVVYLGVFIFLNNTLKIFLFIYLGILLAIPTLFFLVINGWTLGWVIAVSGFDSFLFIIPHGIFEFTALFIGTSLGLKLGVLSYKKIKTKEVTEKQIKESLKDSFKVFTSVIVPLLAVASIIEVLVILI